MKLAVHDTETGHWSGKRANHISCVFQQIFTHSSQDSHLQPFLTYIVFSDSHKLQEHVIKLPDEQKIKNNPVMCTMIRPCTFTRKGRCLPQQASIPNWNVKVLVVGTQEGYLVCKKSTEHSHWSSHQRPQPLFPSVISVENKKRENTQNHYCGPHITTKTNWTSASSLHISDISNYTRATVFTCSVCMSHCERNVAHNCSLLRTRITTRMHAKRFLCSSWCFKKM